MCDESRRYPASSGATTESRMPTPFSITYAGWATRREHRHRCQPHAGLELAFTGQRFPRSMRTCQALHHPPVGGQLLRRARTGIRGPAVRHQPGTPRRVICPTDRPSHAAEVRRSGKRCRWYRQRYATNRQCGDDRYHAVDAMILKRVDVLPHGLVNNVAERLGADDGILLEYVRWVSARVLMLRDTRDYRPVLHLDTYGTPGIAFGTVARVGEYLARLGEAAEPFALRVEHPMDAGSRDAQIATLVALREILRRLGSAVEIVADEWCNTFDDVRAFVDAAAADMIQVKTPDLGGLDQTALALRYCVDRGVKAYCAGPAPRPSAVPNSASRSRWPAAATRCWPSRAWAPTWG